MIISNYNNDELLFWKVIRNKFLFKKIIYEIENEKIQYSNIEKYYLGNKIKFKYIQSLKWMVEKLPSTYSILIDKLNNNDQIINFNENDISYLFRLISSANGNHDDENEKLIKLFIEKKFNEIENQSIDLILLSIKQDNLRITKLLVNQFKLTILPSVLEYSIENSTCEIIEFILSSLNFKIYDKIKLKALSSIFENPNSGVISLILNNPIFFIKQDEKEEEEKEEKEIKNQKQQKLKNQKQQQKKQIKKKSNNIILKIKFLNLFKIKSRELQNEMINKNQVERPIKLKDSGEENKISPIIPEELIIESFKSNDKQGLLFYLNVIFKLVNSNLLELKSSIQLQQQQNRLEYFKTSSIQIIFKQIIIETKSNLLYFNYLLEYDEFIEEFSIISTGTGGSNKNNNHQIDQLIYEYTFKVFSIKGLNYLIKRYNNIDGNFFKDSPKNNFSDYQEYKQVILKHQKRLIEFLKFYYSKKSLASSKLIKNWKSLTEFFIMNCDLDVLYTILNEIPGYPIKFFVSTSCRVIPEFKRHQWYIDNVLRVNLDPMQYRYFNKIVYKITNEKEIDYLLSNYDFYQYEFESTSKFTFLEQFKFAKYFDSKINELVSNLDYKKKLESFKERIYYSSYYNALINGDIEILEEIDKLDLNFENISIYSKNSVTSKINKSNIINTCLYLSNSGYKSLLGDQFNSFIYSILKLFEKSSELFEKLKFNFIIDPIQSIICSHKFLCENNLHLSNFILSSMINQAKIENIDIISKIVSPPSSSTKDNKHCWESINLILDTIAPINNLFTQMGRDSNGFSYQLITYGQYTVDQVYQFIEFIVLNFGNKIFSNKLFNHLYSFYLQIQGTTIDDISKINLLYNSNQIEIKINSIFKTLFVLNSKSILLSNFLISSFSTNDLEIYNIDQDEDNDYQGSILSNLINSNQISIQFILENDYKTILSKLINFIVSNLNVIPNSFLTTLLIMNEIDYFFQFLEIDQNHDNSCNTILKCISFLDFEIIIKSIEILKKSLPNYLLSKLNQIIFKSNRLDLLEWLILNNKISSLEILKNLEILFKNNNSSSISIIKYLFIDNKSYLTESLIRSNWDGNNLIEYLIQYGNIELLDIIFKFQKSINVEPIIQDSYLTDAKFKMLKYLYNQNIKKNEILKILKFDNKFL